MAGKTKQTDRQTGYAQVFRALGDSHRLHILEMLREREMNAERAAECSGCGAVHPFPPYEESVRGRACSCQKGRQMYLLFCVGTEGRGGISLLGCISWAGRYSGDWRRSQNSGEGSWKRARLRRQTARTAPRQREPVVNKAVTATDVWERQSLFQLKSLSRKKIQRCRSSRRGGREPVCSDEKERKEEKRQER